MALRRHVRRGRRGFWRAREGATAIEFALVVFPFCFMLFAILEVGLYFTVDSVLDNAAIETGRLIRTGQAEAQGMSTPDKFKDKICSRMLVFASDCKARMTVTVQKLDLDDPPKDPSELGEFPKDEYTNGAAGDLMLVRVWYEQPMMTGFMTNALAWSDGKLRLSAATAFRNEPK